MARFRGRIGYATESVETVPGVYEEQIAERTYSGDVIRNAKRLQDGTDVNPDITLSNSISIVADEFAREHIYAIRYVRWAGSLWKVTEVEAQAPRLILRLGGVYNGPSAEAP